VAGVVDYRLVQHVINPEVTSVDVQHDVTRSAPWANACFKSLHEHGILIEADQNDICMLLNYKTCVPTSSASSVRTNRIYKIANVFKDLQSSLSPSARSFKDSWKKVFIAMACESMSSCKIVFDRYVITSVQINPLLFHKQMIK